MPGPYYVLTARTAGELRQMLDDGGTTATPRPNAGARTRGLTWVKVTGSAVGGWYPGLVSIDSDGTFSDLTGVVNVASASGAALVTGTRYLCSRTGNTAAGVPRFRTVPPGGGGGDVFGPASSTDNALARFDGLTGKLIQNSNATLADSGVLSLTGIYCYDDAEFLGNVRVHGPDGGGQIALGSDDVGQFAKLQILSYPAAGECRAWLNLPGTASAYFQLLDGQTGVLNCWVSGASFADDGVLRLHASAYGIQRHGSAAVIGQTGTLAAGATVTGGIITDLGSGSGGGGTGTVTSVNVSGGSTGMTFTGGPVTTSGTITMSGTLDVDNGGTGRTSHTAYAVLCGGTSTTSAQQSVASLGTAGQVLTSAGAGALPTWQDASGGGPSSLPGVSVFGRAPNSTGAPAAITATANGLYLQRVADAVSFAALAAADLTGTKVSAYLTAAQSLVNGTPVALAPFTETEDVLNEFTPGSGVFIPAQNGTYLIDFKCQIGGGGAARVIVEIRGPTGPVKYFSDGAYVLGGGAMLVTLSAGTNYSFVVTALATVLSAAGGAAQTTVVIRRFY